MNFVIAVGFFVLWIYLIHWTERWPRVQVAVVLLPLWIVPAVWLAAMVPEWVCST